MVAVDIQCVGRILARPSEPPGIERLVRVARALAYVAALAVVARTALAASIEDPGQGRVPLEGAAHESLELSGMAWAGGTRFLAVSDKGGTLCTLEIDVDPTSGRIRSALVAGCTVLDQATDLEGIAWAGDGTVYVSDERGPAIRRYDARSGVARGGVALPAVFRRARRNLSLESLTLAADGTALWTANEEALEGDGPTNREANGGGTLVRLQRFLPSAAGRWRADGQWAYAVGGVAPFLGRAPSGVVDLAALPDGRLLVLERAAGALALGAELPTIEPGVRSRIYLVDSAGATETSRTARLGPSVTPVTKTLLWEASFGASNFEGMALGPPLADGAHSLVLVADGGQGLDGGLYALRVLAGERAAR